MIVFLIIMIALIAVISLLVFLSDYFHVHDPNAPKIKFSAFKTYYDANPKRWRLEECSVVCVDSQEAPNRLGVFTNEYRFYFSFIDWLRFSRWRNKMDKQSASQVNAQITAKMMAIVEQDIERRRND